MLKTRVFLIAAVVFATLTSFAPHKGVDFYQGSYDNFLREARKQKKAVILDFWASWCSPCQKLDRETFSDKNFADYTNKNYLVYRVDIDTFDGMEIVDKFGVDVFPTMLVLDHKANEMGRYKGFFNPSYFQKELTKLNDARLQYGTTAPESIVFNK